MLCAIAYIINFEMEEFILALKEKISFPDLQKVLESSTTLDEAWINYEKALRANPSISNSLYANKLEEFRNMLATAKLKELEKEFGEVKEHLRKIAKKYNVKMRLTRRQKDFVGLNEKIRLYILQNRPVDQIRDFLGFRLTLCTGTEDTIESVKLCYEVMNELMEYFIISGSLLTEAEPILKGEYKGEENLIIPSESYILDGFEDNVKDYIRNPKQNGYQSLHCTVRKTDGLLFEIQVRTEAMEYRAEFGSADHLPYKSNKYNGAEIRLDLNRMLLKGFRSENESVCDLVGLVKAVDPFGLL